MKGSIETGDLGNTVILFGKCFEQTDFRGKVFGRKGCDALYLSKHLGSDAFGLAETRAAVDDAMPNSANLIPVGVLGNQVKENVYAGGMIRRRDAPLFSRTCGVIFEFELGVLGDRCAKTVLKGRALTPSRIERIGWSEEPPFMVNIVDMG